MIKVLLISIDKNFKSLIEKKYHNPNYHFINFCSTTDSLDIMSQVCTINPSILILDDDFLGNDSLHLLQSIKKVNPKLNIIFTTSNTSLELGRKIHSIGVKFYMIKPISEFKFYEFLKAIEKEKSNVTF
jgi:response regulator of citrate/malate metabolism